MSSIFAEHRSYIADSVRLERFKTAIDRLVKPGDRVADLGCGFGVLGLLCLKAGAARVFGVDSTRAIHIAREVLDKAGLGERYVCIAGLTQQVELPERVDVAICDHVGYFGFDYGIVELLQDARERFLRPGGTLIPSRIVLKLCAVQSKTCRDEVEAWRTAEIPAEYRWLRDYDVNAARPVSLKSDELLSEPQTLGAIDLHADKCDVLSFEAELRVARDGVVDGLAGWFDCELGGGVWMTNSPLAQGAIQRSQVFLAIDQPLAVSAGETLLVSLVARPSDSVIAWTLEAPASERRFAHSTWKGMILSKEDLNRERSDWVPRLSRAGRAQKIVLDYCDGSRTSREIERAVLRDHPHLFPTEQEISRFIGAALRRDAE